MAKDLSKQLSDFMKNYRKAQEDAKTFEGMQKSLSDILADSVNTNQGTAGLDSMNRRVNTLIGAIRDNALTPRGILGIAGEQRLNQVKNALNPKANNVEEKITTTVNVPEESITTTTYPDGSRSRSVGMDADGNVYFKYMSGDTLGNVIKELGLQTDKGLWGPDGDVAYYTKQLREQGIDGNIPTDRVIKLQKRK